jgi:hypothetical protein
MRSSILFAKVGAAAASLLLSYFLLGTTRTARADTAIAADAELAVPISTTGQLLGVGFAGRLGHRFRVPLITFTPELGGDYHTFDGNVATLGAVRGIAGARLGIGEIIRPTAYAHLGYGYAWYSGGHGSFDGFTYDFGVALDFVLLPLLDLGLHASYASILTAHDTGANWIALGVHAALIF